MEGQWSAEEVRELTRLMASRHAAQWRYISEQLGRYDKHCLSKWTKIRKKMNPRKGRWQAPEDVCLLRLAFCNVAIVDDHFSATQEALHRQRERLAHFLRMPRKPTRNKELPIASEWAQGRKIELRILDQGPPGVEASEKRRLGGSLGRGSVPELDSAEQQETDPFGREARRRNAVVNWQWVEVNMVTGRDRQLCRERYTRLTRNYPADWTILDDFRLVRSLVFVDYTKVSFGDLDWDTMLYGKRGQDCLAQFNWLLKLVPSQGDEYRRIYNVAATLMPHILDRHRATQQRIKDNL